MNNYNKKQSFETIIWDWNGTLLNDISLCVRIVNTLLPNHSELILDEKAYKEVFGFPITAYYESIGIDFNKESFESLTDKFIGAYNAEVTTCGLHQNVGKVLPFFNENEIDQYILTAAYKESVCQLLAHFDLEHFFKAVEGLDNFRAESKLERGFDLIENNKINQKTTVLIGDTIHDFEVATALGVSCILIANGHQSKERLIAFTNNEILILDEINQLKKMKIWNQ